MLRKAGRVVAVVGLALACVFFGDAASHADTYGSFPITLGPFPSGTGSTIAINSASYNTGTGQATFNVTRYGTTNWNPHVYWWIKCVGGTTYKIANVGAISSGNGVTANDTFGASSCGAAPSSWRVGDFAGTTWYGADWTYFAAPPARDTNTCPTNSYDSVVAGIDGTTASIYFKWKGSGAPPGWRVYFPDPYPSTPGTGYKVVPTTPAAGSYFGGSFPSISGSPTTYRLQSVADSHCYVYGTLSGDTPAPGSDTGADESGASCGFNPLCYTKAALRWAFVPSEDSMDTLSSGFSEASDKFPFSVIGMATDIAEATQPGGEGCSDPPGPECWPTITIGEGKSYESQVFAYDSDASEWLRANRNITTALVWLVIVVPLALSVFWRIVPVVGGKD